MDALAHNGGLIQAAGGDVWLQANATNALLRTVVNNEGTIEAVSCRATGPAESCCRASITP